MMLSTAKKKAYNQIEKDCEVCGCKVKTLTGLDIWNAKNILII